MLRPETEDPRSPHSPSRPERNEPDSTPIGRFASQILRKKLRDPAEGETSRSMVGGAIDGELGQAGKGA
jgi:hypothetical protein